MKTLLLLILFACTLTSAKPGIYNPPAAIAATATTVYICDSKTSVAYHSKKDCRGLNRCTHEIISVSENDAINKYEKRKCKECW